MGNMLLASDNGILRPITTPAAFCMINHEMIISNSLFLSIPSLPPKPHLTDINTDQVELKIYTQYT